MNQLLLRRRAASFKKQTLPYDAEVEYVQFTGPQTINTGIIVAETDIISIDIKFLSNTIANYNQALHALDGVNAIFFRTNQAMSHLYARFGSVTTRNSSYGSIASRHIYSLKKGVVEVDGNVLYSSLPYVAMPNSALKIGFADGIYLKGEVYACYITDSSNAKRIDLIPVRVGTIGYMYDRVSGTLFGNGDLIAGPDKN